MKKLTLSIGAAFFAIAAFAQQVTSITIIPSPATASDNLQAVVTTVYPGGPCSFVSAFPKTMSNDTVIFDAIYCFESDGPEQCAVTDTFDIGQLTEGTYVVRFRLTSTAQGGPCGMQSYQLRDIEFQSFTVGQGTVGISGTSKQQVQLYPNPVQDNVFFSFENHASGAEVRILDMKGKLVKTALFSKGDEVALDISELPANLYFYTIKTNTETFSGKFAKQ